MKEDENKYFNNLFEFVTQYSGASISAARKIAEDKQGICINWAGGLHHANKSCASGFCHINDIVMCIQELLKSFKRVMYIDIDCHAGVIIINIIIFGFILFIFLGWRTKSILQHQSRYDGIFPWF